MKLIIGIVDYDNISCDCSDYNLYYRNYPVRISVEEEIMEKKPVFELFQGVNRDWYWHLKAPNGHIIAVSEGYSSKQMAKHGITSVIHNASLAETIDRPETPVNE